MCVELSHCGFNMHLGNGNVEYLFKCLLIIPLFSTKYLCMTFAHFLFGVSAFFLLLSFESSLYTLSSFFFFFFDTWFIDIFFQSVTCAIYPLNKVLVRAKVLKFDGI